MADAPSNPTQTADAGTAGGTGATDTPLGADYSSPTTAPGDTAAPTVFSGLALSGSAKISANTPKGFDDLDVPTQINGSPAAKGVVRGNSKAPNIAQLSQLVKVVQAVGSGHPLDGFSPATQELLAKTFNPAQIAALNNGKAPAALQNEVLTWAWKGTLAQMKALGVSTSAYPDVTKAPTMANATSKLTELGSIPLESNLTRSLGKAGYDTKGMTNVGAMVSGHDSSEFDVTKTGQDYSIPASVSSTGTQTAAQHWDEFVTDWNDNKDNFQQNTLKQLVGAGALDISAGNPTATQVASAYQNVITHAAQNKQTVSAAFADLDSQEPPTIDTENINQADVLHYADQLIGANILTPYQATTLANLVQKAGTSSTAATDLLNQAILSDYTEFVAKGGAPSTQGSSYAAATYDDVQNNLAQQGIQASPSLINAMLLGGGPAAAGGKRNTGILQIGVSTPYELSTLAANAADEYAKANIGSVYGAGVATNVKAGTTVAQQAKPYQAVASSLLGIPEEQMDISDPSGKWMTWSQGGSGDGGIQTMQEYTHQLMTDPQFGYSTSQQGKAEVGTMVAGMAALLGRAPQGGGSGQLTGMGSNAGQGQAT